MGLIVVGPVLLLWLGVGVSRWAFDGPPLVAGWGAVALACGFAARMIWIALRYTESEGLGYAAVWMAWMFWTSVAAVGLVALSWLSSRYG